MPRAGKLAAALLILAVAGLGLAPAASATTIKLGAVMTGDQEVPPVATDASGFATLTYDDVAQTFDVVLLATGITIGDLQPNPGRFHLHGPAFPDMNAGVIVDLGSLGMFMQSGPILSFSVDDVPLPNPEVNEVFLLSGQTYLNLHTLAWPTGEIRGQVVPEPSTLLLLGTGLVGLIGLRRRRAS